MFDYAELNKRIESGGGLAAFAAGMCLSERVIRSRLSNKTAWKQSEIIKAAEVLNLTPQNVDECFFTYKY